MSARLQYKVEALREQIARQHDNAVKKAEEKYAADQDIASRVQAWRDEAELRVLRMADAIRRKEYVDSELSGFSIRSVPSGDKFGPSPYRAREQEIIKADNLYERRIARLDAMITQDDNSLWLTTTMLNDLFGL